LLHTEGADTEVAADEAAADEAEAAEDAATEAAEAAEAAAVVVFGLDLSESVNRRDTALSLCSKTMVGNFRKDAAKKCCVKYVHFAAQSRD
jgi:predicted glycosyl hydrolase (DUF1957 family)